MFNSNLRRHTSSSNHTIHILHNSSGNERNTRQRFNKYISIESGSVRNTHWDWYLKAMRIQLKFNCEKFSFLKFFFFLVFVHTKFIHYLIHLVVMGLHSLLWSVNVLFCHWLLGIQSHGEMTRKEGSLHKDSHCLLCNVECRYLTQFHGMLH